MELCLKIHILDVNENSKFSDIGKYLKKKKGILKLIYSISKNKECNLSNLVNERNTLLYVSITYPFLDAIDIFIDLRSIGAYVEVFKVFPTTLIQELKRMIEFCFDYR
jgi:hypothetical protein